MYQLVISYSGLTDTVSCTSYSDALSKLEMAQNTWYDNPDIHYWIEKLPE